VAEVVVPEAIEVVAEVVLVDLYLARLLLLLVLHTQLQWVQVALRVQTVTTQYLVP
jgi:hypothetical protein